MQQYSIVLFKNKSKNKLIKKFVSLDRAKQFYDKLLKESKSVLFEVQFQNTKKVSYDIALIDSNPKEYSQVYLTDELGRNVKVKLEDGKQSFLRIDNYKREEKFFDVKKNKKIDFGYFISNYFKGQNLKMVYVLNNKIVVQEDDKVNLFSFKNEIESERFIDCLTMLFFKEKRKDCLFIKDNSIQQKKYLYNFLAEKGFDKKTLYRKSTTFQAR